MLNHVYRKILSYRVIGKLLLCLKSSFLHPPFKPSCVGICSVRLFGFICGLKFLYSKYITFRTHVAHSRCVKVHFTASEASITQMDSIGFICCYSKELQNLWVRRKTNPLHFLMFGIAKPNKEILHVLWNANIFL